MDIPRIGLGLRPSVIMVKMKWRSVVKAQAINGFMENARSQSACGLGSNLVCGGVWPGFGVLLAAGLALAWCRRQTKNQASVKPGVNTCPLLTLPRPKSSMPPLGHGQPQTSLRTRPRMQATDCSPFCLLALPTRLREAKGGMTVKRECPVSMLGQIPYKH